MLSPERLRSPGEPARGPHVGWIGIRSWSAGGGESRHLSELESHALGNGAAVLLSVGRECFVCVFVDSHNELPSELLGSVHVSSGFGFTVASKPRVRETSASLVDMRSIPEDSNAMR